VKPQVELPEDLAGTPPPRALYLHFPFCVHRCHYCDFSVTRRARPPVSEWIDAIDRELAWWFERARWERPLSLETVFVGGGTPSLSGTDGPHRLRERLERWFLLAAPELEWTVEANPASLSVEVARAWRGAGANRLSLGVQAFDDEVLKWLGRLHDREGAKRAISTGRGAGFERISIDMMFGLPEGVHRDLEAEVEVVLESGVGHVSAYGLTIEPRTPLAREVERGRVTPTTSARYAVEYGALSSLLTGAGLTHYEVSNFARPGHECRHNWYYWNRSPYLGIGPSAHGFFPPHRVWNEFRWDRYCGAVRLGDGAVEGWERLDAGQELLERLWLGLRTREGLSIAEPAWAGVLASRVDRWLQEGWIRRADDRIVATVEGWLRLDELVAEIGRDMGEA